MFDWIVNGIQDFVIGLSFPEYEEKCYAAHLQEADLKFSVMKQQMACAKIKSSIVREAASLFSSSIRTANMRKSHAQSKLNPVQQKLDIFQFNYKQALDNAYKKKELAYSDKKELYANIEEIRKLLQEEFDDKSVAYDEVNKAQEGIDSWYYESQHNGWFSGNGGKEIPSYSFFGQSHSDLSYYKDERDDAYKKVEICNSEIDRLKCQKSELMDAISLAKESIKQAKDEINKLKSERQLMFDLKKQGYHLKGLQTSVTELNKCLSDKKRELRVLCDKQTKYISAQNKSLGVLELSQAITQIKADKKQFITEFNSKGNQLLRQQAHKKQWLKAHSA